MAALQCAAVRREYEALADGPVPPARAAMLAAHIETCAACRAAHAAEAGLRSALRELPADPLPADFTVRLHRRLAIARPEVRTWRWWLGAVPATAAAAGFVAAALLAQPALAPGRAEPQAAERTLAAAVRPGTQSPIAQVSPALFPYPGASEASGSAAGAAPTAGGIRPLLSAPAATSAPAAVSLTLLASSPAQAVQSVGDFAVAGGGSVVTTFLGPSSEIGPHAPQPVATIDAVIPGVSVPAYTAHAASLGTVLAQVADGSLAASEPVRLIVTVLGASGAPRAATAAAAATVARGWETRVLLAAARAAPWAGGGCAIVLVGGIVLALTRPRSP